MSETSENHISTKILWESLGPYKRSALVVLALVLLDTSLASLGVGIVLPLFQMLLDNEFKSAFFLKVFPSIQDMSSQDRLLVIVSVILPLFFFKAIVSSVTTYKSNNFLLKIRFYWVDKIGEVFLFGRLSAIAGKKQGALVNNWYNETLAASRFFQSALAYLSSLALALALLVLGFFVSWKGMVALIFVGWLLVLALQKPLYSKAADLSKTKLKANQAIIANMAESLANLREIKLLQAESLRLQDLKVMCARLKSALLRASVMAEAPRIVGEFMTIFALLVFLVVGVIFMEQNPQEMLPLMAFFFVAFYRLVGAMIQIMSSRVRALNELHSVGMVDHLLKPETSGEETDSGVEKITALSGDIQIKGLFYAHKKGTPTLMGIDAKIPHAKTTLILGSSGSGKSTLLDVLFRFLSPDEGGIEVSGKDIRSFELGEWRRMFGYVSQETALFNGSIRMNLKVAAPEASQEEMERVCRIVEADDFIKSLSEGYDTIVGDRGHTVSGGQRKRISIARALLRKPSILILDEATGAIEQSLEVALLKAIRKAYPDLTLVIVTHRAQSLPDVDWAIVLDKGKVVKTGNWNEMREDAQILSIQNKEEEGKGE